MIAFRLSEIKLDFDFGISEIARVVPGRGTSAGPESKDDYARADSGCASSTCSGMTQRHARATQESEKHRNAIDQLDAGAFKRAAGISRQGHVLFGGR